MDDMPIMDGLTFDPSEEALYWHRGIYQQLSQARTSRRLGDEVLEPVQYALDGTGKPLFGKSGPLYVDRAGLLYRVIKLEDGRLSLAYRVAPREYNTDLVCGACGGLIVKEVQEDGVQNFSCPACDIRRYHGPA